jgi:hypothetical protein
MIYEWQPGSPRDLRTERQLQSARTAPYGDFELQAGRIVARLTGARVTIADDNSQAGMPDLHIEYDDARTAWGEVVIDVGQGHAAQTRAFADGGLDFQSDELLWEWWVTLSPTTSLKGLEPKLTRALGTLELAREHYPVLTETSEVTGSPGLRQLARIGIMDVCCADPPSERRGLVHSYPSGVGGVLALDWPGFYGWLDGFLAGASARNKRNKLARTNALERHLFVGLGPTVPWAALHVLDRDLPYPLPPADPQLPAEVTHLWLYAAGYQERCLTWWPERGWLDAQQHWLTA